MTYSDLPFIYKVSNPVEFGNKVISISNALSVYNTVDPSWLMIVMDNETAHTMDHTIKNSNSSATGLIQFTEATANALGTTTAALRNMSNVDQLDFVYKYLKPYQSRLNSAADVYKAVFYPVMLFKDDSFALPQWVVDANPVFDLNNDGELTVGEFTDYVNTKYADYINVDNNVAVIAPDYSTSSSSGGKVLLLSLSLLLLFTFKS